MAIKTYIENDKKLYEVYVNGYDSAGRRYQRRKREIESLQRARQIEFEFKRDFDHFGRLLPETILYSNNLHSIAPL